MVKLVNYNSKKKTSVMLRNCKQIANVSNEQSQSKPHTTNFVLNELNFCLRLLTKQSVVFRVGKEH